MKDLSPSQLRVREESLVKRVAPFFTIVSAVIAVTALIYNPSLRSRGLSSTYLGGDNIVQVARDAAPGDLQVLYQGKRIEALYSLKVVIKNTGSSSIKDSDVKEPLTLVFPRGYSLVDAPTIQTKPLFQFEAVIDPQATNVVHVTFPLMNGGDEAVLSFKAVALGNAPPILNGRVVDVKQIANFDLSKPHPDAKSVPHVNGALIWSLSILNGVLGTASFFLFLYATKQFVEDRIWKSKWKPKLEAATAHATAEKAKNKGSGLTLLDTFGIEEETRQKEGIPSKPNGITGWKEYLAFAASFLLLATVFGLTTYVLIASSLFG